MEKKNKHRLLGLVVLIALIILLFPLLTKHEVTAEPMVVKAPPFPDQSMQVHVSDENVTEATAINPSSTSSTTLQTKDQQVKPVTLNEKDEQQPDDTVSIHSKAMQPLAAVPEIVKNENNNATADSTETNENNESTSANLDIKEKDEQKNDATEKESDTNRSDDMNNSDTDKMASQTGVPNVKEINESHKIKYAPQANNIKYLSPTTVNRKQNFEFVPHVVAFVPNTLSKEHADINGLVKLKNAAWVIQLGSFKNKTNALRLVNHLRANGYPAFIQQVSMDTGDHIRVFVGPKTQQTQARVLADQLANRMHLQGIVISYQPLAL